MSKVTQQTVKKRAKPLRRAAEPGPRSSGKGFLGRSPFALVLYGPSGVGKTSLAANFEETGFLIDSQEDGIRDLVEYGQAPEPAWIEEVDTFRELLSRIEKVAEGKLPCRTLVGDSLTGWEKLCFTHHCEEYFDGDWSSKGFYSYFQGPKNAAKTDWPHLLDALEGVRAAGINVLLIAHSQVKNYSNPEGSDYDRFSPYLDKETWAQTHRWAKAVVFYNYHVDLEKKGPRTKANPEVEKRFLYTVWSPAFDAKNRFGLDPLIEAGDSGADAFQAFKGAMMKAGRK